MFDNLSDRQKTFLQIVLLLVIGAALTAGIAYLLTLKTVKGSRSVQFQVDASGGFSIITLDAGKVTISKSTTVTTPWRRTVQVPSGTEVYLTASNPTRTGLLTCTINVGGEPWKKETTDAPKDGVACAGIIP